MRAFFLSFLFSFPLFAFQDFQIWLMDYYETPLRPNFRFYLFGEGRWGDDASRLHTSIVESELIYQFNNSFEIGPGLRTIWHHPRLDQKQIEHSHIPYIDIYHTFFFKVGSLRNRFRPAYVFREHTRHFWEIRERLTYFFPEVKKKRAKAYLQGEVIFRQFEGFFENRLSLGSIVKLKYPFKLDLFYMYRFLRVDRERDQILGLRLRYVLEEL